MYVGPDIVQDGLVVVLDAGSTRSYPGTGATWFDLSGNGNDGTLSATSIGTTTSGTMTFDGVDDTVTINYPNLTSSNFTVIGVSKRTNSAGRMIAGKNNWLLGHWSTRMRQYYSVGWVTGAGSSPATNTANDSNVHIWCGTGDISGNAYRFRDDNVEYTTNTTSGTAGPNGFVLGAYLAGGPSEYGAGTITVLLVYNRVLTDAEIDQNFNAQRTRFL